MWVSIFPKAICLRDFKLARFRSLDIKFTSGDPLQNK